MFRIIIDGYNLIFQCGLHAKNLSAPTALEKARRRLVRELADRIESVDRTAVLIVFDAKTEIAFDQAEFVEQGFAIRFAKEFSDADSLIKELLRIHSDPKRLTVVSSDHEVQTAATRRGATAIDSDVWYDSLPIGTRQSNGANHAKGVEKSDQAIDRSPQLSASDQEELLAEFRSIDVSAIEKEIHPSSGDAAEDNPEPDTDDQANTDLKKIEDEDFNPFPPGYGEDLLE